MTDAFAELVMPIFQNVIALQNRLSAGESPTLDDAKRQIKSWIEASEQRAVVNPALAADFDLAKFGLVAWIDEVLTESDWGKKVDWGSQEHVLEWDLYRSHIRAVKFYERAARAERQQSLDPLETYLLCVCLGFRGEKALDPRAFQDWIKRVYERITDASPLSSRPFPDDGETPAGNLGPLRGPSLLVTVSILFAITALTTVLGYIESVNYVSGP
jgi:type VI secretion system protein ImpK